MKHTFPLISVQKIIAPGANEGVEAAALTLAQHKKLDKDEAPSDLATEEERRRWVVQTADAVIYIGKPLSRYNTKLELWCRQKQKPFLVIAHKPGRQTRMDFMLADARKMLDFLEKHRPTTLGIIGLRRRQHFDIHTYTYELLKGVLSYAGHSALPDPEGQTGHLEGGGERIHQHPEGTPVPDPGNVQPTAVVRSHSRSGRVNGPAAPNPGTGRAPAPYVSLLEQARGISARSVPRNLSLGVHNPVRLPGAAVTEGPRLSYAHFNLNPRQARIYPELQANDIEASVRLTSLETKQLDYLLNFAAKSLPEPLFHPASQAILASFYDILEKGLSRNVKHEEAAMPGFIAKIRAPERRKQTTNTDGTAEEDDGATD